MTDTDAAAEEKESLTVPGGGPGGAVPLNGSKPQGPGGRQLSAESAVDSGHGSGDEASCSGGGGGGAGGGGSESGGAGGGGVEIAGRSNHSSESSGRFSLRESVGSYVGDYYYYYDRAHHLHPSRIDEGAIDLPVFTEECDDDADEDDIGVFTDSVPGGGDSLQPLQEVTRSRKISRGSSRGSRGSTSSERGSFSSVTSVTAILKARLGRSSSLVVPPEVSPGEGHDAAEVMSTCSLATGESRQQKPHRSVSLRLPRSRHRPHHDSDTNLPTIYVDDSPQQTGGRRGQRKSSLQRALSLLSMNSLLRHHNEATSTNNPSSSAAAAATSSSSSSSSSQKAQKPVQKILRQPRRRHNTVRGMSGLAIDASYQSFLPSGALHRSNTLYYPTPTSLRHATTRRAKSVAS